MSDKRIIDLEAKQTLGSGDYLAADSAQGTYKVDANTNIMTPLTNVRNNVANSSASPDKYSSSTAYKVGDMVIHDDILYICTTACSAASWAVNSACFTATTLSSAITQLNEDLTNIGQIIVGSKISFSINNGGGSGNVAKIHLTPGRWLVLFSAWHPGNSSATVTSPGGNFAFNGYGESVVNSPISLSAHIVVSSEQDYYVQFTNWSSHTVNSLPLSAFTAIRIK